VDKQGYHEVLGVMEGQKVNKEIWVGFLRHVKWRGMSQFRAKEQQRTTQGANQRG
jgi:transposase-like protein